MSMQISVIGASEPSSEAIQLAEEVGRELARRGVTIVTGGLGGVMEAACKGAKEAGGSTIGILPGSDPTEANPYVDIPICTGIGYARNIIVVRSGRAVIAVAGAFGTLSEIAHALGDGIPVIGLETWAISQNGQPNHSIILAKDPVDAVEKAIEAARSREKASESRRQ
ncbi:MAG: TIGR00725 family protein [Chloroflexi bacterium]|nr:TIGR00725 family protein [Chloroflexota bacterium]